MRKLDLCEISACYCKSQWEKEQSRQVDRACEPEVRAESALIARQHCRGRPR